MRRRAQRGVGGQKNQHEHPPWRRIVVGSHFRGVAPQVPTDDVFVDADERRPVRDDDDAAQGTVGAAAVVRGAAVAAVLPLRDVLLMAISAGSDEREKKKTHRYKKDAREI